MPTKTDNAELFWERVTDAASENGARDTLLRSLQPYYFLDYDKSPTPEEGVESISMPWGTNAIDLVHDLMAKAGYSMSVPSVAPEKSHRAYAETQEKYVHTVFDESATMQGQDLMSRAAWGGGMRGAVCGRVVHKPEWLEGSMKKGYKLAAGGKIPLSVQLRDPLEVWPVFGRDGLSWVVEDQTRKVRDIRQTYGDSVLKGQKESDEVEWREYWDSEHYCYWADGEIVSMGRGKGIKGPWKHYYGGLPYSFNFCRQTLAMEPERRIRPLLGGLTGVIEQSDLLDSMEMTFVSNYVGTPWVAKSVGNEKIKMTTKPGSTIHIKDGESITPLQAGRTPIELQDMQQKMSAHFERGTFPGSMYGTDPGRVMAGYAIAMLNQSGQARMIPIIAAVEKTLSQLGEIALRISDVFLQGKILKEPIPFYWYQEDTDEKTGDVYLGRQDLKFDASKLQGVYKVNVKVGAIMPSDEASQMSLANAARQSGVTGRPMLSDQTIQEKYNLAESPSDEKKRIDEELAEAAPEIAALDRAIAIADIRREKMDELEKKGVDLDAVLQSIETGGPMIAPLLDVAEYNQLPPGAMPGAQEPPPMAVGGSMQAVGSSPTIPGAPPTQPTEVSEALGILPPNPEEIPIL